MKEKLYGAMIPEKVVIGSSAPRTRKRRAGASAIELLQQLAETPGVAGAHVMAPAFSFGDRPGDRSLAGGGHEARGREAPLARPDSAPTDRRISFPLGARSVSRLRARP